MIIIDDTIVDFTWVKTIELTDSSIEIKFINNSKSQHIIYLLEYEKLAKIDKEATHKILGQTMFYQKFRDDPTFTWEACFTSATYYDKELRELLETHKQKVFKALSEELVAFRNTIAVQLKHIEL